MDDNELESELENELEKQEEDSWEEDLLDPEEFLAQEDSISLALQKQKPSKQEKIEKANRLGLGEEFEEEQKNVPVESAENLTESAT